MEKQKFGHKSLAIFCLLLENGAQKKAMQGKSKAFWSISFDSLGGRGYYLPTYCPGVMPS